MQWLSVEVRWPLGLRFFMTCNQSFSNEASSQVTPLYTELAGTSLGTTTTSRGINHSLASEILVIYSKIYASLVFMRRELHLTRRESSLARRETRGGNSLLSGTVHTGETHKSHVTLTESYISIMSMFINVLVKVLDFFTLLFSFSWNYDVILLSWVYRIFYTYI